MQPVDNPLYDAALGCLLGACVGDAAGATLEFLGRVPTDEEVHHAIGMPGGGFFKLAPGQITDDGELTLCLAQALSRSNRFDIERIARKYADWVRSRPFDMGQTTRYSLGCFLDDEWQERCLTRGYAATMSEAAYFRGQQSKANGSLMRVSALGIWGYQLNPNDLALYAKEDSGLSHPNKSCRFAVACYVIAIAHLMRHPADRNGAFVKVKQWAEANVNEEVCEWLDDAEHNLPTPYHPQAGFIRIGFTHAFRHLLQGSTYIEAITETLKGGGDTDTNACIVGALIGAACGASAIPDEMRMAVLNCQTEKGKHPRPDFLQANQIPALANELLARAPNSA